MRTSSPEWALTPRAALFVAVAALLVYLPCLGFKLVWDDPMLLQLVHERMSAGGLKAVMSSEFLLGAGTASTGYFRPVALLSLVWDQRLGGGASWAFHLTNLLLHAITSGLVVLVLQRVLRDGAAAIFGGLLFAVHPIHVEAVAFVSGRTDLWAACFTFIAVLLWIHGRSARSTWAAFSACLILGMLSKELALMVIPLLICWDLIDNKGSSWIERNRGWLASATVAVAVVAAIRWVTLGRLLGGAAPALDEMSATHLLIPRLLTYAKLLVVPWPMSAFYTPYDLHVSVIVVAGTLLAGALFVLAIRGDGKRLGLMGLVWTFLFLVPVLGIVSLSTAAAAERFLYLPSFGLCLAAAVLWGRLYRWKSNVALAVGGVLLVVFAGTTVVRSRVWRNELTLYEDMARTSPHAFVAHFNLGNELAKKGQIEAAEAHLARAVDLAPGRADAWNNLGSVRATLGRDADAEKAFGEAIRLKPDLEVAARNRARSLIRLGQPAKALVVMESARAVDAGDAPLLIELGTTLADASDLASAERAFRLAMRAAPDQATAYSYLGFVYLSWNRPKEAVTVLEQAVALDPQDATARSNLAAARQAAAKD